MLSPKGYAVVTAGSGREALERVASERPDLILLDVLMPEMDGYEVCRRLREDPASAFIPVVMITASGDQEKIKAIEAGADDFIVKPLNQAELLARVGSLLRIKDYHDTIESQAAELAAWNRTLQQRVQQQVEQIERLGQLRRFLSPQVADMIVSGGDENILKSHRREISVVYCDLRGFTAFAEAAEPEDVMAVVQQFHEEMGEIVFRFNGTLERISGDGLLVLFNDPLPCEDAATQAVRMAVAMRDRVGRLAKEWRRRGHPLDFGAGITLGYATLGKIGFEERLDYGAIGVVTSQAARLCDEAAPGQILVTQRIAAEVEELAELEAVGELALRGFAKPAAAFNVVGIKRPARPTSEEVFDRFHITAREKEVAALIAQGRSNRDIAEALVITEGTAANHVEHILKKLAFNSRAQIAAWAVEQGLCEPAEED
jgi:class 3 adenylate cyclase